MTGFQQSVLCLDTQNSKKFRSRKNVSPKTPVWKSKRIILSYNPPKISDRSWKPTLACSPSHFQTQARGRWRDCNLGRGQQTFFFRILDSRVKSLEKTLEKSLEKTLEKKSPQNASEFWPRNIQEFDTEYWFLWRCGAARRRQKNLSTFPYPVTSFRSFSEQFGSLRRIMWAVLHTGFSLSWGYFNPSKNSRIFQRLRKTLEKTLEFFRTKTLESLEKTLEKNVSPLFSDFRDY